MRLAKLADKLPVVYRTVRTCGSVVCLVEAPVLRKGASVLSLPHEKHKEMIVYTSNRHLCWEGGSRLIALSLCLFGSSSPETRHRNRMFARNVFLLFTVITLELL